mgnify:CR=1 FL=1
MLHIWKGTYEYAGKRLPDRLKKAKVSFDIHVSFENETHFTGTITEDLATGGMKGTGTIKGKIKGNKIAFIKQMPFTTVYTNDGTRLEETNAHRKLYYTGIKTEHGFQGEWKFRIGFRRIKNKWFFFPPSKGKWEVTTRNN